MLYEIHNQTSECTALEKDVLVNKWIAKNTWSDPPLIKVIHKYRPFKCILRNPQPDTWAHSTRKRCTGQNVVYIEHTIRPKIYNSYSHVLIAQVYFTKPTTRQVSAHHSKRCTGKQVDCKEHMVRLKFNKSHSQVLTVTNVFYETHNQSRERTALEKDVLTSKWIAKNTWSDSKLIKVIHKFWPWQMCYTKSTTSHVSAQHSKKMYWPKSVSIGTYDQSYRSAPCTDQTSMLYGTHNRYHT